MAFYRLEPWGSHYDDLRAGVVASMIGNVHRDHKKRAKPVGDLEFISWNDHACGSRDAGPILLGDADAQSDLITRVMFPART